MSLLVLIKLKERLPDFLQNSLVPWKATYIVTYASG